MSSVRRDVAALAALEEKQGTPQLAPLLRQVEVRFENLTHFLPEGPQDHTITHDELDRHFGALALAIRQLLRLHVIESNRRLVQLAASSTQQAMALAGAGALLGVAVLFLAWRVVRRFRENLDRQAALEASLAEAQEAQQRTLRLEALGRLAGGIAHDFNNLLAVILAHAEFMATALEDGSPLREEAEGVLLATDRAAALVRQIRAFSREEVSELRVIDLNTVVRGLELLLRRLLGERSTLVVQLDPEIGRVLANAQEIERLLVNLVSNARDAMPGGGTVTIETANSQPGLIRSETSDIPVGRRYVRLSVKDTGTGMEEAVRTRVFEPYYSTKAAAGGGGLGLSIAHNVVTAFDGVITVDSEPNVGTQFDVYLPHHETAESDPSEPLESMTWETSDTTTILLAEDETQLRKIVARVLRRAGCNVIEAEDGSAALEICRERRQPIDLIVTDVVMPKMTGPELAGHAKHLHPESPILYMSGYTDTDLPAGTFVLRKPFRIAQLLERVRALTQQERGLRHERS